MLVWPGLFLLFIINYFIIYYKFLRQEKLVQKQTIIKDLEKKKSSYQKQITYY